MTLPLRFQSQFSPLATRDQKALHPAGEGLLVLRFRDQVQVVALDPVLDQAKPEAFLACGEGGLQDPVCGSTSHARETLPQAHGHVHGKTRGELRPRAVNNLGPVSPALPSSTSSRTAAQLEREIQLLAFSPPHLIRRTLPERSDTLRFTPMDRVRFMKTGESAPEEDLGRGEIMHGPARCAPLRKGYATRACILGDRVPVSLSLIEVKLELGWRQR